MAPVYRGTSLTPAQRTHRYNRAIVCKICLECGVSFEGQRSHADICSMACRKARRVRARPPTFKVCPQCGQSFGPLPHLARRYCSAGCAYAARRGRPSSKGGKTYPHLQRARVGACLTCGKEFRATKDFDGRRQVYCSRDCYLRNRRVSQFEQRVGVALESAGLVLERQKRVKDWVVDFAVQGTVLLVEADGSYWHASPQAQARDKRKDEGLTAMGYELFRIDEMDFRQRGTAALLPIIQRYEDLTGQQAVQLSGHT